MLTPNIETTISETIVDQLFFDLVSVDFAVQFFFSLDEYMSNNQ